jgi:glycine/D-amino acid oxidase-like deaminating enzyme
VVVGAGLTGLACAIALRRRGVEVAVLEARSVGAGASGRSGGIVLEDTAAGPLDGVGDCIALLESTVRDLGIECDLSPGIETGWELAHRSRERGAPSPPGWSDEGGRLEVVETVPARTLDPAALVAGLARAFVDEGGTLVEGVQVRAIETRDGPTIRVILPEGGVRASHVVLGLNGYARSVLGELAPVRAALTLAVCTVPLGDTALETIGLARGNPFYTVDLPYLWGRPLPDGRVVFGGGLAFDPDDDLSRIDVDADDAGATLDRLEARVRGLQPALSDVSFERRWGGPIAFRRDRRPVLARLAGAPRVLVCGGYAGHGIALALRVADVAAGAIVDGRALPTWGSA